MFGKFAIVKDVDSLKVGKLTTISTQMNASYNIPTDTEQEVEHGFVENFCKLFRLRERLKTIRNEIMEKEYTSSYSALVDNLNDSDRRHGLKFMVMSLKAQIDGLKMVINRDNLS